MAGRYATDEKEKNRWNPSLLPAGTLLAHKYRIRECLGVGGFGITYAAEEENLRLTVAVKELFIRSFCRRGEDHRQVCLDEKDRPCFEENKKRFLAEARILALFHQKGSEGIVGVREFFEENGTAYLVMEYLDGVTLRRHAEERQLTVQEIRSILRPVCRALEMVHQFGVIHKDVSPDNIMILKDGGIRLLDFGGAGAVYGGSNPILSFKRGYAAPEQYSEQGRIGPWTDVYGTAATLYYCLAGNPPPDAQRRQQDPSLSPLVMPRRRHGLGRNQEEVLRKALAVNPEERYQGMEEFWSRFDRGRKTGPGILAVVILVLAIAGILAFFLRQEQKELFPGCYVFESRSLPGMVLGIDGGFGDEGARVILTEDQSRNSSRFFVVQEEEGTSLVAAHTSSPILEKEGLLVQGLPGEAGEKDYFEISTKGEEDGTPLVRIRTEKGAFLTADPDGELVFKEEAEPEASLWAARWSEKNSEEPDVIVHREGEQVTEKSGTFEIGSSFSEGLSWEMAKDPETNEALLAAVAGEGQQFELRQDEEGFCRIAVLSEGEGRVLGLADGRIRAETEDPAADGQRFRLIYGGWNRYLIQAWDGGLIGLDENLETGNPQNLPLVIRPFEAFSDDRMAKWFLKLVVTDKKM